MIRTPSLPQDAQPARCVKCRTAVRPGMNDPCKCTHPYTAIKGKLDPSDRREAYVTGPCADGSIRPIASFWFYSEAIAFAKKRNEETVTKK